jgi:hypothetical protein
VASGTDQKSPAERDAVNDIYDHGCDLVEAAAALRRAATRAGAAGAAPAVLGCIDEALRDLAAATQVLDTGSAKLVGGENARCHESADVDRRRARMGRGFASLGVALHNAAAASAAARSLIAHELSSVSSRRVQRGGA